MKSKVVAFVLWLVGGFGWLGFHRMYLGKWGTAVIWIFTGGLFWIGSFYDLLTLPLQVDHSNAQHQLDALLRAFPA